MDNKIIEQCYHRSIELLIKNSNHYGVIAAIPVEKAMRVRYDYIFGRDACICALGMVASQNKKLIKIAKASLETLAKHQTKYGQIPYSVNPSKDGALFYFLGCIDSTLWWLIALDFYHKYSGDRMLHVKFQPKIKKALKWLMCQDQNNCGLLEQCESADWTDDIAGSGKVLYSNALWIKVLDIYGLKKEKKLALDGLNNIFLPHLANPRRSEYLKRDIHRIKELNIIRERVDNVPYYLNYIGYKSGNDRCDVYGNCLAILFNAPSPVRAESIIRYLRNQKASRKYPVQVLFPPIEPGDYDWKAYMDREECLNQPECYHNGGIWPYIGCFWAMVLKKIGLDKLAGQEMEKVAAANKVNDWEFNEWFHGRTGKPMGMAGQSWNAGMFLLAHHYLKGEVEF
ncbi:MAG: glycoside hydrolase 100 family protein [Patescibacteria group bacterium]|nr:glycoside hydrolase 100 family protein [Patescibacteria group bacterium]